MAMAEAAIQGIGVHGLRWKHNISLGGETEIMGKMNSATPDEDVRVCADQIAHHVRAFISCLPDDKKALADELAYDADDLEEMSGCGIDEVRSSMKRLYDTFDYNRVCVVG
jgi:hypothetical protein